MRRLILPFLLLAAFTLAAAERITVQTGHIDSVTKIGVRDSGRELVSVSKDGSLRVWDTSNRNLLHKMQISPLPLVELELHPSKTRAAVIESDGIAIHRLSVWDWKTRRRIFTRDLDTLPLYLAFSPKGTFLAYSNAEWQSMTVLDGNTGGKLPYITNGFGIVGAFRVSSSEGRLALYLPSGSIQYRNLRNGSMVQEFPTVAGVEAAQFVLGNRYMIGKWEDSIIAIDLLSGGDVGTIRIPNLLSFSVDSESGEVVCFSTEDANSDTIISQAYTFTGSTFRSKFSRFAAPQGVSSNPVTAKNILYTGTSDGRIYYQTSFSSSPRIFSKNNLALIHDFDASASVIFTTTDSIVTIYSDYLFGNGLAGGSNQVLSYIQPNPLQTTTAVNLLADGTYVLRDASGDRGMYWLFSPVEGAIDFPNDGYESPLTSTDTKNQSILTVDTTGRVRIFNELLGDFEFETQVFGLQTAIYVHGDNIVASGRRSQTLRTSKLLIDTNTGETVPFADNSLETFELAYEPLSHTLYSLSIEGSATDSRTVLTQHTGPIFETGKEIFSMPGNHSDAAMDVNRGTLFLSSGGINRALYSGTGRFIPVESNDNIPAKVEVLDDWLIGLNRDSSVSVWNRATGAHAMDFYLFEDLEWVALSNSGQVFSSVERTSEYIKEF